MDYGLSRILLSNNRKEFTSRVFQQVCNILRIKIVFTTTYDPQTNVEVERYNRTISPGLSSYVEQQFKCWDLYKVILTFKYNSQIRMITN